jgi:hypothetical protein
VKGLNESPEVKAALASIKNRSDSRTKSKKKTGSVKSTKPAANKARPTSEGSPDSGDPAKKEFDPRPSFEDAVRALNEALFNLEAVMERAPKNDFGIAAMHKTVVRVRDLLTTHVERLTKN